VTDLQTHIILIDGDKYCLGKYGIGCKGFDGKVGEIGKGSITGGN
jgi:hypothetical protein